MKKISKQSCIIIGVSLIHLLFVSMLFFKAPHLSSKKERKPLLVKSILPAMTEKIISSPIPRTKSQPKPTSVVKKPVVEPVSSVPKPTQPKAATEKKLPPRKETLIEKKATAVQDKPISKPLKPATSQAGPLEHISPSLLRELEESIAKIEAKDDKNKKDKKTKQTAPLSSPLQIDALDDGRSETSDDKSDYIGTLTRQLHASLNLPDFGEVKIELILKQDGTVAKLKVLKAESEQNRKYLEKRIPELKFPRSGSLAQEELRFVLNFCNEL